MDKVVGESNSAANPFDPCELITRYKKSANGPLQFMEKYIDKKEYPEEIRLACLQWAQAYRDEYGKKCDEVLTSGDLLVILPGMLCVYVWL